MAGTVAINSSPNPAGRKGNHLGPRGRAWLRHLVRLIDGSAVIFFAAIFGVSPASIRVEIAGRLVRGRYGG
jgi:hypothetical protein